MSALARANQRIERHQARLGRLEGRVIGAAETAVGGALVARVLPERSIAGIPLDIGVPILANGLAIVLDNELSPHIANIANGALAIGVFKQMHR